MALPFLFSADGLLVMVVVCAHDEYSCIAFPLFDAGVLQQLDDVKGKPLFPLLYALEDNNAPRHSLIGPVRHNPPRRED